MLYQAPGAAVLIDPQVPDDLWPALDERVAGRPVVVLTTIRFHSRTRNAVIARYDGVKLRHDAQMPAGVDALAFPRFDETMFWLPGPRALVAGDRLIGDGASGVRVCPVSWLGYLPGRTGSTSCARRCGRCSSCRWSMCWSRTARLWWGAGVRRWCGRWAGGNG